MIATKGLSCVFESGRVLNYRDWQLSKGDHGVILGASGSGKTTLLHIMSGLLKPSSGSVIIDETDITGLSGRTLDAFRGKNVGFIFQNPHLIPSLSVSENVQIAGFLGGGIRETKVAMLLEVLGLQDLAGRKINQISHGQAQRVAIARALMNEPKVIFGDEPTASLDDASCDRVIALLQEQAASHGASLVLATHDQRVKQHFSNHYQL